MSAASAPHALLEARALSKAFPGVRALDAVDLDLAAGEVHALCGENGAGKSTLVKILAGLERADSGTIRLDGRELALRSPRSALAHGIATIHQEVALVPDLSVAENLFLGRLPRRWWGIDWRGLHARARAALARVGLELDVRTRAGALTVAEKQRVAIARALDLSSRVLLMDEPTSSLDAREAGALFDLVRELAGAGLALVFIGHALHEVEEIADRVTVLRGGKRVATFTRGEYTRVELVRHMLGRELNAAAPSREDESAPRGVCVLQTQGLGRAGALAPIDCALHEREVVGLAGLLGAGKSELVRLLFGADASDRGALLVAGRPVAGASPRLSVRRRLGYCPEDRRAEGIFPSLSVLENLVLVVAGRRGLFARFSRRRSRAIAIELCARLSVACAGLDQPIGTLSGGNQQKVLLARWLAAAPRVLLLDEPTRGVDIGARADLLAEIRALARGGLAVLFASSALEELCAVADRLLVLHDRGPAGEFDGPEYDTAEVMHALAGGTHARER
jgi:simple sugar transport system ATP-binding protein